MKKFGDPLKQQLVFNRPPSRLFISVFSVHSVVLLHFPAMTRQMNFCFGIRRTGKILPRFSIFIPIWQSLPGFQEEMFDKDQ